MKMVVEKENQAKRSTLLPWPVITQFALFSGGRGGGDFVATNLSQHSLPLEI
jgi:hypothetical protein